MKNDPTLTVVGAGPGDPDLITLKAIKALRAADVILFDALVNKDLLKHAQSYAEFIFVGKRSGYYRYTQEQINDLIVDKARLGQHVVRLKGGDPFVFGRGFEEMTFAARQGISVAMVPGISSAAAVPAYQHIPLTKRGSAESFWVITGMTKNRKLSDDIALAAQSTATVVILMGMGKLHEIIKLYQMYGKGNMPVAIIQNGTCPNEKFGIGTIDSILDVVAQNALSSPSIIVIGPVVSHREELLNIQVEVQLNEVLCA